MDSCSEARSFGVETSSEVDDQRGGLIQCVYLPRSPVRSDIPYSATYFFFHPLAQTRGPLLILCFSLPSILYVKCTFRVISFVDGRSSVLGWIMDFKAYCYSV